MGKRLSALTLIDDTWAYLLAHRQELSGAIAAHLGLSAAALGIGASAGIMLGTLSAHSRSGNSIVAAVNGLRVIPSLAVLTFMLPLFGLGFVPALIALILLACPPVLINTDVGFRGVSASIKEAAYGMGMRPSQVLARVEGPLALPIIVAGVRTAAVEVIASATLATFIGGGGLGDFIVRGLENNNTASLLLGAICVAGLALSAEVALATLQRWAGAAAAA